jgi:hypothetical protein
MTDYLEELIVLKIWKFYMSCRVHECPQSKKKYGNITHNNEGTKIFGSNNTVRKEAKPHVNVTYEDLSY